MNIRIYTFIKNNIPIFCIMFTENKLTEKERAKLRENVQQEIFEELKRKAIDEAMEVMINDILREQEGAGAGSEDTSGCIGD